MHVNFLPFSFIAIKFMFKNQNFSLGKELYPIFYLIPGRKKTWFLCIAGIIRLRLHLSQQ